MTEAGGLGFGFGLDFTDYRPVLRSLGEGGSLITVFYPLTLILPYRCYLVYSTMHLPKRRIPSSMAVSSALEKFSRMVFIPPPST